jgi:hypothetical protein
MGGAGESGREVVRAERRGNRLRVTLDFEPGEPLPSALPTVLLLSGDGRSAPVELPMRWEGEDRLAAEYTLVGSGTWHPVVKLGERVVRAPPVVLPYAPEFEPGSAKEGKELLESVAKVGGGVERLSMAGLFKDAPESEGKVPLAPWMVGLAVGLLVAEVVVRRLLSVPRLRRARPAATAVAPAAVEASARKAEAKADKAEPAGAQVESPPPQGPKPPEGGSVDSALEAARQRAKRRLGR